MTEPTELLPCPFCGGPVELEETTSYYNEMHGNRQWWGVVCRNTTNHGGSCAIQQRPSASKEAAVKRWNTRAPQPTQAQAGAVPLTDEQIEAATGAKIGTPLFLAAKGFVLATEAAPASGTSCMFKLERFAALVAAREREACAQVCESWGGRDYEKCAAAIRAKGKP